MTPQVATMAQACKTGILNDVAIRELCQQPTAAQMYEKAKSCYLAQYGVEADMLSSLNLSEYSDDTVLELQAKFTNEWRPMIGPFEPRLIRYIDSTDFMQQKLVAAGASHRTQAVEGLTKVISFGTTSFGYDVTLSEKGFKIFSGLNVTEIDPMEFDDKCLVPAQVRTNPKNGLKYILLPPHSYGLGVTREYFFMPRDVVALCIGKSTYARTGVLINATPIEPGFEGNVVVEVANLTPIPARVYLNTGIAQFLFFRGEEECEESYADRGGKYMCQTGVQLPLV